MRWLVPACLVVVAAAALAARRNAGGQGAAFTLPDGWAIVTDTIDLAPGEAEVDQSTGPLDAFLITVNPTTYTPAAVDDGTAARNVRAFLDMLGYSEGADYDTLFGGATFDSFAAHPNQRTYEKFDGQFIKNGKIDFTTAAGRYQITMTTWSKLAPRLGLSDFSPASQDAAAIELIRERGALRDVQAGRLSDAIAKVRPVWASLPGAGYGQPERQFSTLAGVFAQAGGTTESIA